MSIEIIEVRDDDDLSQLAAELAGSLRFCSEMGLTDPHEPDQPDPDDDEFDAADEKLTASREEEN
jgi:hypothetical protein